MNKTYILLIYQMVIIIFAGAPLVQAINFTNILGQDTGDMSTLAVVFCSTQNSPPTDVTWMKDGEVLVLDSVTYWSIHEVTNRANSRYDVKLMIGDVIGIGGVHNYTCAVNNSRGRHSKTITTSVSGNYIPPICIICFPFSLIPAVWSESRIIPLSEPVHGHPFMLSCVTYLQPKLTSLSQYIVLEWVGPDGVSLTADNNITIGEQTTPTTSSLQFNTINLTHHGLYVCRASLNLPRRDITPTTSSELYLTVLGKSTSLFTPYRSSMESILIFMQIMSLFS